MKKHSRKQKSRRRRVKKSTKIRPLVVKEKLPKTFNSSKEPDLNVAHKIDEISEAIDEITELSLSKAKMYWFFGEWEKLASLNLTNINKHPERERFALLMAAAQQQLGNQDKAKEYTKKALDWGCPPKIVAQVLLAGIHNTLGRAAALKKDKSRIKKHFGYSVDAISTNEEKLVIHARSVKEMTSLGLLRDASELIGNQVDQLSKIKKYIKKQNSEIVVLKSEIDLLNHELSIAQQKGQLNLNENPINENIKPESDLKKIKKKSVSQLGQDLWVLEKLDFKKNGFFVEFGATNGVQLSNTYLLEKYFEWNGICAEPNPGFFKELVINRQCVTSQDCIGPSSGEIVDFVLADAFGGLLKYANQDMHAEKRKAYRDIGQVAKVKTISLDDFLKKYNAPKKIDYLSIDTEGSEYDILQALSFDRWNITLITVEHNFSENRSKIRNLLERHGYSCIEKDWDDWFYK